VAELDAKRSMLEDFFRPFMLEADICKGICLMSVLETDICEERDIELNSLWTNTK
jgi:hypothetical protein